jgi:hypothetical protein
MTLEIDDLIVLYTDGITEAMNKNNIEFGEDNLKTQIIIGRPNDGPGAMLFSWVRLSGQKWPV